MSTIALPEADVSNPLVFRSIFSRMIFCVFVLTSGLTTLCILFAILSGTSVGTRDFVSYWAAGKQLIHGGNPYDATAILGLEKAIGYPKESALIMRNPPSALFLVVPLGLMGARVGSIVWSIFILVSLAASVHFVWRLLGSPPGKLHFLSFLFAPALYCLVGGQTSVFALLGYALFLRLHRDKPLLAGAGLSLCALKPHLFLPFIVVLFVWIYARKAYSVLAGAALALAACCAIAVAFDPRVWQQYAQMAKMSGVQGEFMPDLGTILRFIIDRNLMWLQFLPAMVGCAWALWYFHVHRSDWDWLKHGSLVLLVSMLVAPYSWFPDQAILLPAILHGLYSQKSLLAIFALISAGTLEMILGVNPHSVVFAWSALACLAWYLWPPGKHHFCPSLGGSD